MLNGKGENNHLLKQTSSFAQAISIFLILFFALVVFVIENLMIGVILDVFQLTDGAKKKLQRQQLLDGLRVKKVGVFLLPDLRCISLHECI